MVASQIFSLIVVKKIMKNALVPTAGRGPTAYLCITEAITVALLQFSCQLPIYL